MGVLDLNFVWICLCVFLLVVWRFECAVNQKVIEDVALVIIRNTDLQAENLSLQAENKKLLLEREGRDVQ